MRRPLEISILTLLLHAAVAMVLQRPAGDSEKSPRWFGHWVTTWSGATQPFPPVSYVIGLAPPPEFQDAWDHGVLQDQTIRIVVQSTLSGSRVRIRLSNQYGKQPLTIGAAHIVRLASGDPVWRGTMRAPFPSGKGGVRGGVPGTVYVPDLHKPIAETEREIFFEGRTSVVIPGGGIVESDAVAFDTGYRGYMVISLYLPNRTEPATLVDGAMTVVQMGNTPLLDN